MRKKINIILLLRIFKQNLLFVSRKSGKW